MKLLRAAIMAALPAILWLTPAAATPVAFEFSGSPCQVNCDYVGLSAGESITAVLAIDSASLVDGAILDSTALLSFTIGNAGLRNVTDATHPAWNWYFTGQFDAASKSILGFIFAASDAVSPSGDPDPQIGVRYLLDYTEWGVAPGHCYDGSCLSGTDDGPQAYSSGQETLTEVTGDAPEPLTASLFAAGLFGLGFQRRRVA